MKIFVEKNINAKYGVCIQQKIKYNIIERGAK